MDRADKWLLQPVPAANNHPATPPGRTMARSPPQDLRRRYRSHREVARPSRAASAGEDQPRPCARRRSRHWQRHAARAGEARGWAVELLRGITATDARAFNGFIKSVILRVSEVRDLGDINRYQILRSHEGYTAAPPDVLRVDEKNLREHSVLNCCGVIITTNTRRTASTCQPMTGGTTWHGPILKRKTSRRLLEQTIALVRRRRPPPRRRLPRRARISAFDPKAPPPKTAAFWDIVDANRAPEDAELADVLDQDEQSRRHHHQAHYECGARQVSLPGMDGRPKEPPSDTAPAREMRLRTGPQRRGRRRPLGHQWQPTSGLRQAVSLSISDRFKAASELARREG